MDQTSLLIFALLGWGLSLYFGFFRFRQYQWTRRKVEGDLFVRLNQNGRNLYWKLRALTPIRHRNAKLTQRQAGVLEKYLDHWAEKRLLLQQGTVGESMGRFWLRVWLDELRELQKVDKELATQLSVASFVSFGQMPELESLLSSARDPTLSEDRIETLYRHFTQ